MQVRCHFNCSRASNCTLTPPQLCGPSNLADGRYGGLADAEVEVAFKEQMAGQNSLLLLTHLALGMMEGQLRAAAADVHARRAQVRVRGAQPVGAHGCSCGTQRQG